MGRHRRAEPRAAHRADTRTFGRVAAIVVALLTLAGAFWLSDRTRAAILADGDGSPSPSTSVEVPVSTTEAPPPPSTTVPAPDSSESVVGTTAPRKAAPAAFWDCAAAKAAGVSLIPSSDPRYVPEQDRDGDGVACDRHGDPPTPGHTPVRTPPLVCIPKR